MVGLGLGIPCVAARARGGSALTTWLSGATYADWDPSKLDRMFTTSVGPTNVASNGDSIGLLIGGSQLGGLTVPAYLAAATEKVVNGGFAADSDWTKGTNWTIGSGVATHGAGASGNLDQAITLTAGRVYVLTYTVTGSTAGSITPQLTGGSTVGGSQSSTNGTFTQYLQAVSGNNNLRLVGGTAFDGSIDNVSLKELPGYHALQSTSGDRPQYQSGYMRGDGSSDNLLTTWLCHATINTFILKAIIPASTSSFPVLIGASGGGTSGIFLRINSSGFINAVISGGASVGTKDLRAKTVVLALTTDGTTDKLFAYVDGVVTQEYSGATANSGSTTTVVPCRLAALNASGTPSNFSSCDQGRTIAAQKAMTLAEFTAIAPLLAA